MSDAQHYDESSEMSKHKSATHYHALSGLLDKSRAIKGLVTRHELGNAKDKRRHLLPCNVRTLGQGSCNQRIRCNHAIYRQDLVQS